MNSPDVKFEIAHVLFIDIVGYSKLLITEQSDQLQILRQIVRGTDQFKNAEAKGKLFRLPTGDGGALVFFTSPETPVLCALEISKALKNHPELSVRMGIHSGPVNRVMDLNEQANIAGAGINIAQRVMDCGDTGHILLSRHVAEDLEHYPRWRACLHPLGDIQIKHGDIISVVNFYQDQIGNPATPQKFVSAIAAPVTAPTVHRGLCLRHWIIGILIGTAVVFGALLLLKQRHESSNAASNNAIKEPGASALKIPEKSIAVLPFDNLSRDPDNAFFASGIQDEILTRLAKVGALKVISRTSTQQYQTKPGNLSEIGKQLGVANILEGSVQKVANAVHVNVQLIKAATDEHLWAESYDRDLQNIFGVEGEVAGKIAEALNAKLSGAEEKALATKPTNNVAAYDAYLHGRAVEAGRFDIPGEEEVAADYTRATQLDPNFALAWANVARVRAFLYFNAVHRELNSPEAVKEAAERASALQPELGEALIAQGSYRYLVMHDFPGALEAFEQATKRLPNSADAFGNMAFVERRMARWDAAEAHFRKAIELDPRNLQLLIFTGELLGYRRNFTDAQEFVDRALQIAPNAVRALVAKANLLQAEGQLEQAAKAVALITVNNEGPLEIGTKTNQLFFERRFDAAMAQLQPYVAPTKPGEPLDLWKKALLPILGYCQQRAGKMDDARATFAQAIQEIKPSPESTVLVDQTLLPCALAMAYAGLGDKTNALAEARKAVSDYQDDALDKPQAELTLAQVEAQVGEVDAAIAAIPHLLEVPAGITPGLLRLDPYWDPLRGDPRFEKFCKEK